MRFTGFSLLLVTGIWAISSYLWADSISGDLEKQSLNLSAIIIFLLFVGVTLAITGWASRRSRSRQEFYTAGGGIPAWQNGVAISGDFLSAATFLGITSGIYATGIDGLLLVIGTMAAWPILLFLISERLRNLGRFTFIDVISFRLNADRIKPVAAAASLVVLVFYLIGQIVGAGKLIQLLFGMDYTFAVITVSTLMVIYVVFGGMLAATWVQFIKAVLLIGGGSLICLLAIAEFDFNLTALFDAAIDKHPKGSAIMGTGLWMPNPWSIVSTGLTLSIGFVGLPHVLMRLFTVKDASASRRSAFYAVGIISTFNVMIIVIGFAAVALITGNPEYHDASGALIGGGNMVVLNVTHYLAGDIMLGFIAAVAFATILAVVAGLTISAAATVSHDIYGGVFAKGEADEKTELRISRISIVVMGLMGVATGLMFENQNIAFVTTMAVAIAASANAPVLLLSMYWAGLTTRGAIAGIGLGLVSSIVLIILGPVVWVAVLGNESPIFPLAYPTIVTFPMTLLACWLFSVTDKSESANAERAAFADQYVMSETGYGRATASDH